MIRQRKTYQTFIWRAARSTRILYSCVRRHPWEAEIKGSGTGTVLRNQSVKATLNHQNVIVYRDLKRDHLLFPGRKEGSVARQLQDLWKAEVWS